MLFDRRGQRKYLVASEWSEFVAAAELADPLTRSFCLTLAYSGARISEVLSVMPQSVDQASNLIVVECLKRRTKGIYRAIPLPRHVICVLQEVHNVIVLQSSSKLHNKPLWPWCRTTAWSRVKTICAAAGVPASVAMPKAFRHAFGVRAATQAGVPLGTLKRWLGHARLDSTIIYTEAVGEEERALALRMWSSDHDVRP